MSDVVWLLIIGAAIGLVAIVVGAILNYFPSLRAQAALAGMFLIVGWIFLVRVGGLLVYTNLAGIFLVLAIFGAGGLGSVLMITGGILWGLSIGKRRRGS